MIVLKLFSKKKETDKDLAKAGIIGTTGAIALTGKDKLIEKLNADQLKKFMNSDTEKVRDNKKLGAKLLKNAKSQGIKVTKDPKFYNSAYLGTDSTRLVRKGIAKGYKFARKTKNESLKNTMDGVMSGLEGAYGKELRRNFGKDTVVIGNAGSKSSAVLAHELGHAQHYNGRNGSLVGKLAHKLHGPSAAIVTATNSGQIGKISSGLFAADGFRRGKNSVKTDENGNVKIDKKKALKSAAIGGVVVAPFLVAEAAASRQGYKLLKKNGASKELLKAARKELGHAYGTYVSGSLNPAISELGGHGLGVAYGVVREKRKHKKKD